MDKREELKSHGYTKEPVGIFRLEIANVLTVECP